MGNKKNLIWYLTLFDTVEKSNAIKVIKCDTINEIMCHSTE